MLKTHVYLSVCLYLCLCVHMFFLAMIPACIKRNSKCCRHWPLCVLHASFIPISGQQQVWLLLADAGKWRVILGRKTAEGAVAHVLNWKQQNHFNHRLRYINTAKHAIVHKATERLQSQTETSTPPNILQSTCWIDSNKTTSAIDWDVNAATHAVVHILSWQQQLLPPTEMSTLPNTL